MNGYTAEQIFNNQSGVGYTYDDLIFMPGGPINFGVNQIDLSSKLSKRITLRTPIISSPMDTVTQADMAIALALQGGIGIIHTSQSISQQVAQVLAVKRFRNGIITDPYVLKPTDTVATVLKISKERGYSGFPITETGELGSKLVGIVTKRDIDFIDDPELSLDTIMTPRESLVTAKETDSPEKSTSLLQASKKGRLPIINAAGQLTGMICRKDLRKYNKFPLATVDKQTGQLLVGAAITTAPGYQERAAALIKAGTDVIVIDSSQGYSSYQIDSLKWLKETYPQIDVIAGNVVTVRQAQALVEVGADALRVGMGVGSICTTQDVCGVGRPQATAVFWISQWARTVGIPVIADGGLSNSGKMFKALVFADTLMLGGLLAGTDESPGDYFYQDNIRLKEYRGMGSIKAQKAGKASGARYFAETTQPNQLMVAQGVSGTVTGKGSVANYIPLLIQGVKHGMQDVGCSSLGELHKALSTGELCLQVRSIGAIKEGAIHDLYAFEN